MNSLIVIVYIAKIRRKIPFRTESIDVHSMEFHSIIKNKRLVNPSENQLWNES